MDEKRFDVDGAYNSRYEVVKNVLIKLILKIQQKELHNLVRFVLFILPTRMKRNITPISKYCRKRVTFPNMWKNWMLKNFLE